MTIDEAIKHCLEVAENKEQAAYDLIAFGYSNSQERNDCQKCANDHRQLAEWLKDYQRLLTGKSSEFELLKDGTLIIESDIDLMTVNRILLSQRDTAWGVLFYPDKDNARNSDLINNYDTISRQAAIDLLKKWADGYKYIETETESAMKEFERLPSAQPEIIHCRDCKHHWTHRCMDSMPTETCDLNQTFYDPNIDFCSLAERRTDG